MNNGLWILLPRSKAVAAAAAVDEIGDADETPSAVSHSRNFRDDDHCCDQHGLNNNARVDLGVVAVSVYCHQYSHKTGGAVDVDTPVVDVVAVVDADSNRVADCDDVENGAEDVVCAAAVVVAAAEAVGVAEDAVIGVGCFVAGGNP